MSNLLHFIMDLKFNYRNPTATTESIDLTHEEVIKFLK